MSPSALLEIEEKTQNLIPLDGIRKVVDHIYAVDVSGWSDADFAALERAIDHIVGLLSTPPIPPEHRPLIEQLLDARAGVEQGVSPDPEKRPTAEQMRSYVSAHL